MGKTLFFGGTFNPVHKGHVAIAEEFIEKFSLDLLYIIPNRIPPLKDFESVSGEDRTEMLKIAFSGNNKTVISDIELNREGTSYTCDTVAELKSIHPESRFFLLTGDDWIDSFDKWKNFDYLMKNVELVIAYRGEKDITASLDKLELLSDKRPKLLGNSKIKLSSTQFRTDLNPELLPEGVFEYIEKRGLYGK